MDGILILNEQTDIARFVTARNLGRQYDLLHTAFKIWSENHGLEIGHRFIQDVNYYATQFLSPTPGLYRRRDVDITNTTHKPPPWQEVEGHMDDFIEEIEKRFKEAKSPAESTCVSAYVLWRLNWIHPFIQGNGRTARALSYFVLCQHLGQWLPGEPIIPEQIRATRDDYCSLLRLADNSQDTNGGVDLKQITHYLQILLTNQLAGFE